MGGGIPPSRRFLLLLAAAAIQSIYIPTSLLGQGGIAPRTALDVFPLWQIWVIPYVLCYPLWAAAAFWIILKMDDRAFRAAAAGAFLTFGVGVLTYLLFPTYVIHPVLEGSAPLTRLLQFLYTSGGNYSALPSAHIYMSTLLAVLYRRWYPRLGGLWAALLVLIALSTLFTRQHYLLDVVCGLLLGWAGARFGLWWSQRRRGDSPA